MSDSLKMIEGILEGQGLTQEQVAEVINEMSRVDFGDIDPTRPTKEDLIGKTEMELRSALDKEDDWRIKAKLAARIISLGLE